MRFTRQAFSLFLILGAVVTYAQLDTNWLTLGSFIKKNNSGSVLLNMKSSISSNAVNAKMIGDYLTKPTFTDDGLTRFNASSINTTNLFYNSGLDLNYIVNEKWEANTSIDDVVYYTTSTALSKLLLNGNKDYVDESVESKKLNIQRFRRVGVSVYNRFVIKNHILRVNYGLVTMQNHIRFRAEDIHLLMNSDSISARTQSNSFSKLENPSVGLQLGVCLYGTFNNNHQYAVDINNANLFFTKNATNYSWANSISFTGIRFQLGNSLQEAVENELDNTIGLQEENKNLMVVLPNISLRYLIPLNSSRISLRASTFYSMYAISTCWHKELGSRLLVNIGVDAGNFQLIQSRTGVEYKAPKTAFMLNLIGLNSLVAQELPGGFGAEFSLSHNF